MSLNAVPAKPASGGRSAAAPKRDAILRAAIDTFAERGYFNAQVADVARAAGVAAGTVYLYFKSKDDLLISIFERSMRDGLSRAAKRGRPRGSARTASPPRARTPRRLGNDRNLASCFRSSCASRPSSWSASRRRCCATTSADSRGDCRRPAPGPVPRRHQADLRGQDALRRARRDGDQLDPQQPPLLARGRRRRGRRLLPQRSAAR
jgi:AcrR family transcriptional regulator